MSTVTIELPEALAAELAQAGREANQPPERVAAQLLHRLLLARRFDRASRRVAAALRPDAPQSEDQALEQIS